MVTESAYGQLRGRWRVLFRKNENNKERVRTVTLACMVLHNICIERGDSIARKLDLLVDPSTQEKRDREEIRKLLQMTDCRSSKDTSAEAVKVRDALCEKLWVEKEIRSEKAAPDFALLIKRVVRSLMDIVHLSQPSYLILPS